MNVIKVFMIYCIVVAAFTSTLRIFCGKILFVMMYGIGLRLMLKVM